MITIAITGGVATGKSSVVSRLADLWGEKAAFFSADAAVHHLLTTQPIKTTLRPVFGNVIFDDTGEVNRGQLRRIVFRDPALRRTLEEILHPEVFATGQKALDQATESGRQMFVYEIPLLYEVESLQKRDFDIVVAASEGTQRHRLREKRGLDPETIDSLLKAQMPIEQKVLRADVVIWNDGPEGELDEQVFLLSGRLLRPVPGNYRYDSSTPSA